MISLFRTLIIAIMAAALAACATTHKPVDPRTLSFEPLKFTIPKSERITLGNGMIVYLMEDHELPLVNITAYVKTGGLYELEDRQNIAGLTGAVMRSGGTATIPPDQLDAELEFMASGIETGISGEMGNVSMTTLKKNFDRTLDLFGQVMLTPGFKQDRVDLAINQTLEGLRRQNDDPKGIANRELGRVLYANHPFGRVPTMEMVKKITRDDLVDFHKKYFHPNSVMLAVSGDFVKQEMIDALNRVFGTWQKVTTELPKIADPAPATAQNILFAKKQVSQSVVRLGHLGVDKSNPDIYAIRVMDYILGGGFTSRLMQEVRSNQGLAYHAASRFDIGRSVVGTFIAETETKSATTAKTIALMRSIIAGMTTAPVTDQELQLAKDSLINSFIYGFAKADSIVNQQVRLEYFDYPDGYLENYRDNLAKVTKEDVLRVARKYLHPDALTIVVVGDDKSFDQPLSTFGVVKEIKLEIK